MANIFYTFNFTVSVMLIYLFMLLFTRVTMGKAKIAATVWNGIITFATSLTFCLIPWMLYGDASYWILHKHEQLYTLLHWSIFFVFYLTAYPKESILIRCFNAVVNFIIFAAADISVVLLAGAVDAVFGIHYAEVIASTERWSKWYNLFTTMPVVLLYLAVIPLLKWLYPRLHIQLKNHKQVLCLMTFPLAQFFAIYTLVTILQQFHAIGTSPGMQLLLGATILLNVVSSIVLLYFMRKMYQKEQEEQKIRFFEEYETLSKQYQTQAEQASQQVAELRHDFDNQMQVFSGLMQSDAVEDAMQLAKELQTRFQDQKLKLQYCENTIANVILQQTAETCRKKQINFEVRCSLPEMLNIRRVDLCSLLINPLQNAIQASEKVPEGERQISCSIWQENSMVFFRIRNRKANEVQVQDGKFQTTKQDKSRHGFGIDILEHIAKSYGGTADASYDDQFFTIVIQLNLPETAPLEESEKEAVECTH